MSSPEGRTRCRRQAMSGCLLVLVGLPGSGKTTLAGRLLPTLSRRYRVLHVEYDAAVGLSEQARLQAAAAAGQGGDSWRQVRRELERAVEAAVTGEHVPQALREAISGPSGHPSQAEWDTEAADTERPTVYIIDDNMYLRSMRYRYFQVARRYQMGFASVLLDVPVAECVRRNARRPRPVPEAAIRAMAARLERPQPGRLWEARTVTLTAAPSAPEGTAAGSGQQTPSERPGETPASAGLGRAAAEAEQRTPGTPESESPPAEEHVRAVTELVAAALSCPVAPLLDNSLEVEAGRRVCSTSQLHQLDGQLRRLVSLHAAGCGRRAAAANLARRTLMSRVRAGELGLAVEPAEEERFAGAARALFEAELAAGKE